MSVPLPGLADDVRAALDSARVLLLDFDGPLADLMPAPANAMVADRVRWAVQPDWPADIADTEDHIAQLRYLAGDPVSAARAHEAAARAEVDLALQCASSAWLDGLVAYIAARDLPSAVVTNNDPRSAYAFLDRFGIGANWPVAGREAHSLDRMKPHPHLLEQALEALGESSDSALFVGDSVTDVEAGLRAGIPVLGYATRPAKVGALREAGAVSVHLAAREA